MLLREALSHTLAASGALALLTTGPGRRELAHRRLVLGAGPSFYFVFQVTEKERLDFFSPARSEDRKPLSC